MSRLSIKTMGAFYRDAGALLLERDALGIHDEAECLDGRVILDVDDPFRLLRRCRPDSIEVVRAGLHAIDIEGTPHECEITRLRCADAPVAWYPGQPGQFGEWLEQVVGEQSDSEWLVYSPHVDTAALYDCPGHWGMRRVGRGLHLLRKCDEPSIDEAVEARWGTGSE